MGFPPACYKPSEAIGNPFRGFLENGPSINGMRTWGYPYDETKTSITNECLFAMVLTRLANDTRRAIHHQVAGQYRSSAADMVENMCWYDDESKIPDLEMA